MIQGGDHTGTGKGRIGYTIPDEVTPGVRHDSPGQLCMANRGKNTNEAQFFITEAGAPHLDGSYTIFGQCEPATLVQRIARVPQSGPPGNTPLTVVKIEHVKIKKVEGGAPKWMPSSARLPPMPGVPPPGRAVQVPAKR
jgi:peptidyl-prolyl cis-trans isomerase A (cyclophilin A)